MKGQFPWIGRSRGSAGGMTTCKNNDKNVMRAKAFEVTNPNTPSQQNQRQYFAELIKLIGSFTTEQLKVLFPMKPKTMSRRNALTKQLAEDSTTDQGVKIIDFANIDTLGNAPVMDLGQTILRIQSEELEVVLDEKITTNPNIRDLFFCCALVNNDKHAISFTCKMDMVAGGSLYLQMPNGWDMNDNIHPIPLITNAVEDLSTSGFGTFLIKARPKKG